MLANGVLDYSEKGVSEAESRTKNNVFVYWPGTNPDAATAAGDTLQQRMICIKHMVA